MSTVLSSDSETPTAKLYAHRQGHLPTYLGLGIAPRIAKRGLVPPVKRGVMRRVLPILAVALALPSQVHALFITNEETAIGTTIFRYPTIEDLASDLNGTPVALDASPNAKALAFIPEQARVPSLSPLGVALLLMILLASGLAALGARQRRRPL